MIPIALEMTLWLFSYVSYKPDKTEIIFCDEEPVESDFKIENVAIKYSDPDTLFVTFSFTGGDGNNSLRFEFYCLDEARQNLVVGSDAEGSVTLNVEDFDINNVVVVEEGDSVGGWIEWHNVPTGTHEVSTVTKLKG